MTSTATPTATRRASVALGLTLARAIREGDGSPLEAHEGINAASRAIVQAMADEHGAAYLGRMTRQRDERDTPPIAPWDGSPVLNFSADFVLPTDDAELARMILAREAAPYTGTRADIPHVRAIVDRITEIGGELLVWT